MNHLGVTRGCQKPDHLLHTPDMFVRAPLPGMLRATAIVHAAPALGAGFTEYTAEMEGGGSLEPTNLERFVYVLDGEIQIDGKVLKAGEFHYEVLTTSVSATRPSRLLVIERPYVALAGAPSPESFSGVTVTIAPQNLMGDSAVTVRPMVPNRPEYDFAVNLMTFDPGGSLPMVESHVMEHGLLMLSGGGIYRLGECWHPVAAGDFIWMAPYCPQWFTAVGKTPARYIIYKDWNRQPHEG